MKQQVLIVLLFCFLTVNANPFMLIERFCANPNKKQISECVAAKSLRKIEIYLGCLNAVRPGLSLDLRRDNIMCFETDPAERIYLRQCLYGAAWLGDRRGENFSLIADGCIRKYEASPLYRWIVLPRTYPR